MTIEQMTTEQKEKLRCLAKAYDQCEVSSVAIAKEMLAIAGPGEYSRIRLTAEAEINSQWMQDIVEQTILREEGLAKLTDAEKIALHLHPSVFSPSKTQAT